MKKIVSYSLMSYLLCTQLISCASITSRIETNLQKDNFSLAINEILILSRDEDKNKSRTLILNKAQDIENDFKENKIDSSLAISNLQKLKIIPDTSDNIEKIIENIRSLNNSRNSYLHAVSFEEENNYSNALESYTLVTPDDTEHYEYAQERIKELNEYFHNQSKLDIRKTNLISSYRSGSEYHNVIQIILKNKTDKNIVNANITIIGNDSDGNRVKFSNNNSENYFFYGALSDIDIKKGEVWGEKYNWSINSLEKISSISVCIQSIEFTDGSTWINPIYNIWLQQNTV